MNNNSTNNGKQADLGIKTRLAMEEARKRMRLARTLAEDQSREKERFKAAKKLFKRAKKAAKEAAIEAKLAQEELRNLLKISDPKLRAKAPKVAKVSPAKAPEPKTASKPHAFPGSPLSVPPSLRP